MKITKFEHSCYLLEKDGRGLLFDPVEYDHELPEITNLDAIIITHSHGDHFQPDVLAKIRQTNPNAQIFTAADNVANISDSIAMSSGVQTKAGAFELRFYGGAHAEIIAGKFVCDNIGVLVDGIFANPGDSFDLPPATPEILVAPIAAPWLKIAETIAFIEAVKPQIVVPAHDALNSDFGNATYDNWLTKTCTNLGAEYKSIHFGQIS